MRYHDYHLNGYKVSNRGETIELDLVFDYPEREPDQSYITFRGVALYDFTHTNAAIITEIYEVPLTELLKENEAKLAEWYRMLCIRSYKGGLDQYAESLCDEGYIAWCIESAIGFYGFVIAKSVSNV